MIEVLSDTLNGCRMIFRTAFGISFGNFHLDIRNMIAESQSCVFETHLKSHDEQACNIHGNVDLLDQGENDMLRRIHLQIQPSFAQDSRTHQIQVQNAPRIQRLFVYVHAHNHRSCERFRFWYATGSMVHLWNIGRLSVCRSVES